MRLHNALLGYLILGFVVGVHNTEGQTTNSGGIAGVVTDSSGAVMPGAILELREDTKTTIHAGVTDAEGRYVFPFLRPGKYTLTVLKSGFASTRRSFDVYLGPTASINIVIPIASASTSITVTGEAPLIQGDTGDVSSTIPEGQISELPNPGNDLTYVVQTSPGVVMNTDVPGGPPFSILGMPGSSNLFTINGMNENDNEFNLNLVGMLTLWLGQNQIQEAAVVSTGYSGQFGGAAGANVNYITKSGSNEFHGNAQYYWNGRVLNANNWFNNAFEQPRPFTNSNQWAASLGGPIKNDKLFFFFNTEGLRLVIPQGFLVSIPSPQFEAAVLAHIDAKFGPASASAAFYRKIFDLYDNTPGAEFATLGSKNSGDPLGCAGFIGPGGLGSTVPCARYLFRTRSLPSQDTLTSGRVDWNINTNDRAFLQMQYDFGHVPIYVDLVNPIFDAEGQQPWWQGQLVETHTLSSSAASQFMVAGMYFRPKFQLRNPADALAALPISVNSDAAAVFTSLGSATTSLFFPQGRPTTTFQVSEDVQKIWSHQKFGFGGTFYRIYWTNFFNLNSLGTLTPQTLDAFYQGGVDPTSPDVDFTQLQQSFPDRQEQRTKFYNFGLYAQDAWGAQPNLTLSLALRVEHYSNPVCDGGCFARLTAPFAHASHDPAEPYTDVLLTHQKQAFEQLDNLLWSPRFSFAWQPHGLSNSTVLRGGVGIFYDPIPGGLAYQLASNPPLLNSFSVVGDNLAPDETTSLSKVAADSNHAFLKGIAAGQTLAEIQSSVPNFSPPAITVPERRLHFPQFQRWSFELQQAFGSRRSITLGYHGNHGIHELLSDPSANAFGFGSLPPGLCSSPPIPPCADPRFSMVTDIATAAVSNYNGVVVAFHHRWGRGSLQANYAFAHVLDEVSTQGSLPFTNVGLPMPQDPKDLHGSYGSADYDVRHSFNASYVWEVPLPRSGRHGVNAFLRGWQLSGTIFARTGFPYTVLDTLASSNLVPNNYFGLIYAVPTGSLTLSACGKGAAAPAAPHACQPPQLLPDGTPNPRANFIQAGCETGFDMGGLPGPSGPCSGPTVTLIQGRNRFRGPAFFNTDLGLTKRTSVPGWNRALLGIGVQFFNLFNHPNFGFPDNETPFESFGQIGYMEQPPTSILGAGRGGNASARMIQVKVQLQF
jgi:Carboxypeptidase regulatory-like domain/TonB dependent receptor